MQLEDILSCTITCYLEEQTDPLQSPFWWLSRDKRHTWAWKLAPCTVGKTATVLPIIKGHFPACSSEPEGNQDLLLKKKSYCCFPLFQYTTIPLPLGLFINLNVFSWWLCPARKGSPMIPNSSSTWRNRFFQPPRLVGAGCVTRLPLIHFTPTVDHDSVSTSLKWNC